MTLGAREDLGRADQKIGRGQRGKAAWMDKSCGFWICCGVKAVEVGLEFGVWNCEGVESGGKKINLGPWNIDFQIRHTTRLKTLVDITHCTRNLNV